MKPKKGFNKTQSYFEFQTTFGKYRLGIEEKKLYLEQLDYGSVPRKTFITDDIGGVLAAKGFTGTIEKTANFTLAKDTETDLYLVNHDVTGIDVSLPADADADIPLLRVFTLMQTGTQQFECVAGSGATVHGDPKSWQQYSAVEVLKIAADTWVVIGGSV